MMDGVYSRAPILFRESGAADCRWIAEQCSTVASAIDQEELLRVGSGTSIADEAFSRWSIALSAAIHQECHGAYRTVAPAPASEVSLEQAEQSYLELLSISKAAALGKSRSLARHGLDRLTGAHLADLVALLNALGTPSSPGDHALHVKACHLARRTAMLAAIFPELLRRLADTRLASSLAGIAERRLQLANPILTDEPTVSLFAGIAAGTRLAFCGAIGEARYIDRPETPYTRLVTGAGEQLRIHFKNATWLGLGSGQSVWARCKVEEPDNETPYAVAEFEGPTELAGSVWEAWVQQTVRPFYDLSPESIHLFATFPPFEEQRAALHFHAQCERSSDA